MRSHLSKTKRLVFVSVVAFIHISLFIHLLGSRLGPGQTSGQGFVEFMLSLPFVWFFYYYSAANLFPIAVFADGILWGYVFSLVVAGYRLPRMGMGYVAKLWSGMRREKGDR